jgi:putative membrane protein
MMGVGMLFGWIILLGVVVLVMWMIRSASARPGADGGRRDSAQPPAGTTSALHILEERFVRGEIDRREFEERRNELLRGTGAHV